MANGELFHWWHVMRGGDVYAFLLLRSADLQKDADYWLSDSDPRFSANPRF